MFLKERWMHLLKGHIKKKGSAEHWLLLLLLLFEKMIVVLSLPVSRVDDSGPYKVLYVDIWIYYVRDTESLCFASYFYRLLLVCQTIF